MSIEVPLTRGFVSLIDDDDADLILGMGRWHVGVSGGGRLYARRALPGGAHPHKFVFMHTVLMQQLGVDHINGDGLDNRRANLRLATPRQNMHNTRRRSDNTSGYKGVSWDRERGAWAAYIRVQGRRQFLGRFPDATIAALAYDAAAREHFRDFAVVNFPEDLR